MFIGHKIQHQVFTHLVFYHLFDFLFRPWASRLLTIPPTPRTKKIKYRDSAAIKIITAIEAAFIKKYWFDLTDNLTGSIKQPITQR